METAGFYFNDNNYVICALNYVHGPYGQFSLTKELKDTYIYPIGGWHWFNSEEEAYNFFGIPWSSNVYTQGLEEIKQQLNIKENA
jgi:hypothetical protein